jgi:hypothetical protein
MNIQAGGNMSGGGSGSLMTVYLAGDDSINRTDNVLKMIRGITAGGLKGDYSPLHGIGAGSSFVNPVAVAISNLLVPLFFGAFLGFFLRLQTEPLKFGILVIGLYSAYMVWIFILRRTRSDFHPAGDDPSD